MSSDSFDVSDLRHTGTRQKRFNDRKAKWAYGSRKRFCQPEGLPLPGLPASHYAQ